MLVARRMAIGGLALPWLGLSALAADARAAGRVEEVSGEVTAELAARRRVLAPSESVFLGDNVATADRSRAQFLLGGNTSLRLGSNARIRIDRFVVDAGGVVTLGEGPLLLDKAAGSAGSVQVRGSFGLITVRGTRIFVGPSQGVIGIFVVHGLIDVTSGGQSVVLQDGEGVDIRAVGAPPTAPVMWGAPRVRAALASVD